MSGYLGTCAQVMARLSDYLDEDLDAKASVEVETHLRECGSCLAYADSLRRTIELCRAYEPSVKPRPLNPWPGLNLRVRGNRH
jgi:predicted anti-sigma-YlaC factor YlaD